MTLVPKVSVSMLAFNHARFITDAIESVLAQRTSFPIELVVGEDCSTDGTRDIVRRYAGRYPGVVRALFPERNLGMFANAQAVLAACRGEYVACLEGDDYWTHPLKLQRQADLLDSRPDCSLSFHDAVVVRDDTGRTVRNYCDPKPPEVIAFDDILERNFIPNCSAVYRRCAARAAPAALRGLPMGDWPAWVFLAQKGRLIYTDEAWACYRMHAGGAWSSQQGDRQLRNVLAFYAAMEGLLGAEHRSAIRRNRKSTLAKLVINLFYAGRWREARPFAWRCLLNSPRRFRAPPGKQGLFMRLALGLPSPVMRQARGSASRRESA